MMPSMYSGISGLRVHQTKMDVIGNNIANVNTMGFKTQRVTFADTFSQTLQNAGGFDGIGEIGSFQTGTLEMSNVNLSQEFTEMIITQRGFQSNTKIITTSDEILQELVNVNKI
ncbi:hypothetical protein AN639_09010 [Candidatus Epulonipiscium fishelsonii]|uniref:Uncharacterized protein n=1 Tax=Candidatus Epulonipiscium fishelsonii TaxID=77094 RepID=A0ACC8XDU4_9FIRM|nr:hypothetical protein AN639_09010 [Epulopiscium sp. SCG-B05WGA-EpuloA1]ONI40985.1 hypothetical protein AN396_04295 [Epulopiscium sp. SCG-B11WGA-EpuloA1]ONI47337.1 hypothetical protein AN644_00740 [Epulopiscium sp. SCG-C06WGA-EpuloA1]